MTAISASRLDQEVHVARLDQNAPVATNGDVTTSGDVTTRRRGIDELLAEARSGLTRLTPQQAFEAQELGAVLIDIRPQASRQTEGGLPGATVIERTVLEWRLDPACEARLPWASYDLHVVVVCNEGYSSSLAAATLQHLGIPRATDVKGGYRAWKAAGLPTI